MRISGASGSGIMVMDYRLKCLAGFSMILKDMMGEKKEGHGLGLSIIKRIVEKLGGEVMVTSDNIPGKGCIFSFILQTADCDAAIE